MLSDFSNGLRIPIIQKYVNKKDLIEAYSFTQFISYICNFSGQALGMTTLITMFYQAIMNYHSKNNFLTYTIMLC